MSVGDEFGPGTARPGARATVVRSIVLGPDALTRALVFGALNGSHGMQVSQWDGQGEPHVDGIPDLLIIHDDDDPCGAEWLDEQVLRAMQRWPNIHLILLSEGSPGELDRRSVGRARAFVPMSIDLNGMIAVIHLVCTGYSVFPATRTVAVRDRRRKLAMDEGSGGATKGAGVRAGASGLAYG